MSAGRLDGLTAAQRAAGLEEAVNGLRTADPLASASVAFVRWQRLVGYGLVAVVALGLVLSWRTTAVLVTSTATAAYLWIMVDRIVLFVRGLDAGAIVRVPDAEARALRDDELPTYTILVPAYDEPQVITRLTTSLARLDYPAEKLEIMLLLEEDDEPTIRAAQAGGLDERFTVVLVPAADPRTKPKACNYGLVFATGELVTIYDAEDLPEPLQLRRVVATFRRLGDRVACVQAKLAFHNGRQNLLTGWFTAEYGLWFGYLLPGLMSTGSPIPLGGTSNHIRRAVLDEVGAWDPFNVTEDADLGIRINVGGYRTAVVESTTWEEANSDPINWVRQRSRWYKGYLQTWLVHARRPVRLWRALGTRGTLRMTLLLAGTPLVASANMAFWLVTTLWVLGQPSQVAAAFPPGTYYFALVSILFGNASTIWMNLAGSRANSDEHLVLACLTLPLYWFLMGIAACKGCWQLVRNPSYWEKTFHGLDTAPEPEVAP